MYTTQRTSRMSRSSLTYASCILALLWISGCGGGDDENKPVPAPVRKQQAGAQGPPPAPVRRAKLDEPEEKEAEPQREGPQFDPSIDPNTIFQIVERTPTHEIVGPAPAIDPEDQFVAILPPAGHDSSTFSVVSVPEKPIVGRLDPELKLPDGFTPVDSEGYSPDGLPWRIRCDADGALMALVRGGPFQQGTESGSADASPAFAHPVSTYYIDVTEVTLGQWERFNEARKERGIPELDPPLNASDPSDHPVLGVTYNEARAYVAWAGKDLPTEAEWEKAARGTQNFVHPWGNGRAIWPHARTQDAITPVTAYAADLSPYGVYDMAGNAREWCLDWYSETAYQQAAALSAQRKLENWTGPRSRNQNFDRVVRGNGPNWEAWHRAGADMRRKHADVGFRGVLRADIDKLKRLRIEAEKEAGKAGR